MNEERIPAGSSVPGAQTGPISGPLNDRLRRLTPRQKDCLRLARPGYPSKSIARELDISSLRVDGHIGDAKRMLGVGSRFEAARLLRSWEASEAISSLGVQTGAQSAPLPPAPDLRSDHEAVAVADMPDPSSQGAASVSRRSAVTADRDDRLASSRRLARSAHDVRVAPSFFAVAISIVAIAIAVGAVTALLISFDWIGRG
jgi:DNA-binding CsgD family transcriptional regulator